MKRTDAIKFVIKELKSINRVLMSGDRVPSLKFVNLSEVFKFNIEPKKDRFTAKCLDEAAIASNIGDIKNIVNEILTTEEHDCEETHPDITHEEWEEMEEGEVNELLDFDGTIQSSKIPMGDKLNKTLSSKRTTDDVIQTATQSNSVAGAGSYFRRYYGESIEESDLSKSLGFDETQDMDADETIEYFEKEHDMETTEAKERAETFGKTPKLDKKNDEEDNYQRLVERDKFKKLAERKAVDMIEVLLSKKNDDGELPKKSIEDSQIENLISKLLSLTKSKGVTRKELTALINSKK
tara:strand:+ start:872 stop:1756 length:885 start_codon:yes stop_codon:yes gene_type:complete